VAKGECAIIERGRAQTTEKVARARREESVVSETSKKATAAKKALPG